MARLRAKIANLIKDNPKIKKLLISSTVKSIELSHKLLDILIKIN